MKVFGGQLTAALAAAFFFCGCNCSVVANPEGHPCDVGGVCPAGFECVANICHGVGGSGGGGGTGKCAGVVCNMPPQSMCVTSMTLRTFSGVCNQSTGGCEYGPMDVQCSKGCMNGMCAGGTCEGVTCDKPPDPTCQSNNVVTFQTPGACDNGTCTYHQQTMSCPGSCANGACVPTGAAFSQVLPRVRHPVTAVDQEPNRAGDDVIVVGPNAAVSRWNGTQWSPVATGGVMTGNLTSVWFAGANVAFITAEGGLFKLTTTGVQRVTGFPALTGGSKLIDVHGRSESDVIVGDANGTLYRLGPITGTWSTASTTLSTRNNPPYSFVGVYMDSVGTPRGFGKCTPTNGTAQGCATVYDATATTPGWYDDTDLSTTSFHAAGPPTDATSLPTTAWLGLDTPAVRTHTIDGTIGTSSPITGLDGGAVVGIVGTSGVTTQRSTFVMTAPEKVVGHLYRVVGSSFTVEHLMEVLYGHQAISKTESSGVIVVDSDLVFGGNTIIRRGPVAYEALDLGAESWTSGDAFDGGSLLMNPFGDVGIRTAAPTFQLRRFPKDLAATDIAAAGQFAVITASDGTAWRLNYAGGFSAIPLSPPPAGQLSAVCRVSDTELYLVGKSGAAYSYDGSSAHAMSSGTTASLTDVDCAGPGQAVACGPGTALVLKNGQWSPLPQAPANLTQCRLVGGVVYVAGPNTYARNAGNGWVTLASKGQLDGLVVKSVNEAYAVAGTSLLRFDGNGWNGISTAPQSLVTGFVQGARIVYAGNGGVVMEGQ